MDFHQKTKIVDYNHIPRFELYRLWLMGKKVLHIGCVDWPFVAENNLHIQLQEWCDYADGYDVNQDRYTLLDEHLKGDSELWVDLPTEEFHEYDVILIPEVIEHVPDLSKFFADIDRVVAKQVIITVPCAIQCARAGSFGINGDTIEELVHPEHLCWYSPYTLKKTIETHTNWKIEFLFFNNNISCGAVCTKQSG